MGKKTDKMHITNAEWAMHFGGNKKKALHDQFKALPHSHCSLSFLPFTNPVMTPEGTVFDLISIVPWLKKYKTNPLTGEKMEASSLIKMHWSKNAEGQYQCPITFKVFNDHTHIVAIKTTGNVFSYDAVEELNIRSKYWKDLLTDVPFTRKDIITIQDPHNMKLRNMSDFDFVKKGLTPVKDQAASEQEKNPAANINAKGSLNRILSEMSKDAPKPVVVAGSLTPSFLEKEKKAIFYLIQVPTAAMISEQDWLFANVKGNGHIQFKTSLGDMHFELYCSMAPRTCYNMIELAKKGYYDETIFHRSIRNFMIQGGDPTGQGSGGESIYGGFFKDEFHSELSHSGRGMLSMANKGKDTNTSQFCPHLDNKHTVFGKMVGGERVLDACEAVGTNQDDEPEPQIKIFEVKVVTDPFDDLATKEAREIQEREDKKLQREKRQKLIAISQETMKEGDQVGKYLKNLPKSDVLEVESVKRKEDFPKPAASGKKQKGNGFGNFDKW